MNAAERAAHLCDKLIVKGYPFLGAELLLEIASPTAWPLVQVWDDALQALILIACVDQDRQLIDVLDYTRGIADQSDFGDITICYALGHQAWISEFDGTWDMSPNISYIMGVAL